jgi:hypothetical protein
MAQIGYSVPWRKMIREKNQKLKISCQTLFKGIIAEKGNIIEVNRYCLIDGALSL